MIVASLLAMIDDWQGLLNSPRPEGKVEDLRKHRLNERPLADGEFLERLEGIIGHVLKLRKGGRPKKRENQ